MGKNILRKMKHYIKCASATPEGNIIKRVPVHKEKKREIKEEIKQENHVKKPYVKIWGRLVELDPKSLNTTTFTNIIWQ